MSTTWNKLSEWKKKALIALTLVSAAQISAQPPREYTEVPADQIDLVLARRQQSNVDVRNVDDYQHPAYANRSHYRQTGNDQVVTINGQPCVYDYTYSSGIMPYYEQRSNTEKLNSVYQCVDQYGRGIDRYMMVYELPGGNIKTYDTSGENLRQQWQYGAGGFYAHPNYNYRDSYRSGYGPRYGRHSRAGRIINGAVEVMDGIGRIVDAATRGR